MIIGNTKGFIRGKALSVEGHTHSQYAASSHTHTTSQITGLDAEISSLKTSVSEGKALIAAAVTDKGVSTAADATFNTMATNIRNIPIGSTLWIQTVYWVEHDFYGSNGWAELTVNCGFSPTNWYAFAWPVNYTIGISTDSNCVLGVYNSEPIVGSSGKYINAFHSRTFASLSTGDYDGGNAGAKWTYNKTTSGLYYKFQWRRGSNIWNYNHPVVYYMSPSTNYLAPWLFVCYK